MHQMKDLIVDRYLQKKRKWYLIIRRKRGQQYVLCLFIVGQLGLVILGWQPTKAKVNSDLKPSVFCKLQFVGKVEG